MLISRRSSLAYTSAFAAVAANANPASAHLAAFTAGRAKPVQQVQHLVIHADETGGTSYDAPVALDAPDTVWATGTAMTQDTYRAALQTYASRGYGLRRVNAFQANDGVRYSAIWQWGHAAASQSRHDMTQGEFETATADFAAQGYAIAHVDACATASGTRFAAIWDTSSAPAQTVLTGLTAADYALQTATLAVQGLQPRHLAGYATALGARYVAVFTPGAVRSANAAVPAAKFRALARLLREQGNTLRDVNGYVAGGQPYYAAVWEKA